MNSLSMLCSVWMNEWKIEFFNQKYVLPQKFNLFIRDNHKKLEILSFISIYSQFLPDFHQNERFVLWSQYMWVWVINWTMICKIASHWLFITKIAKNCQQITYILNIFMCFFLVFYSPFCVNNRNDRKERMYWPLNNA